jgi:glycolate oxidase iron-sulfur subunit
VSVFDPATLDAPSAADLYRCVHCGLCLQSCPTYLATGLETESPRGRIHLVTALLEGRINPTDNVLGHLDLCLACRACETACPSGVPYGRIIETARASLRPLRRQSRAQRLLDRAIFRELLPHPGRLRATAALLRLYQRGGLRALVRRSGILQRLAPALAQAERSVPRVPDRFFEPRRTVFPARGARRGRVGLLRGCVMPLLYGDTHAATLRVLARNGVEVVVPQQQRCCGALNVHAGEREVARALARRNVDAFLSADIDAVVVNAAGCGSTVKEYGELLRGDPVYAERAARLSAMTRDVTEYLDDLGLRDGLGPLPLRVTLQESCHLVHAQRVRAAPRRLLAAIPGLELADMHHPDECCGSAGLYSVFQPEMSLRLLDAKMENIRQTGAEVIATANPGCVMQLQLGVARAGVPARVAHVVDLLDAAYTAGHGPRSAVSPTSAPGAVGQHQPRGAEATLR